MNHANSGPHGSGLAATRKTQMAFWYIIQWLE